MFDERLVLLASDPSRAWPNDDYIYVDWGPGFYAQHNNSYPSLERSAQVVNIGWLAVQLVLRNGGSCFLPIRLAEHWLASAELFHVADSPRAYMVSNRDGDADVLEPVLERLRVLAALERQKDYDQLDQSIHGEAI